MNRKIVLGCLLGVLGLSLTYAISYSPRQEPVTAPSVRPPVRSAATGKDRPAELPVEELRVRLEILERQAEPFPGIRRNLFGSLVIVAPPPPPPPVLPPPVAAPPIPVEAPLAEEVARQELARFTYLGFLEKGKGKTIFLSGANELFLVKKGDRFGGKRQFLVKELAPDRLIIQQGDDPRPIVLSLVEQASLAPARSAPPVNPRFRNPELSLAIPPPAPIEPMESEPFVAPPEEESGNEGEGDRGTDPKRPQ